MITTHYETVLKLHVDTPVQTWNAIDKLILDSSDHLIKYWTFQITLSCIVI